MTIHSFEKLNLSIKFLNSIDEPIECFDGICDNLTFLVLEKFGTKADFHIKISPQDSSKYLEYVTAEGDVDQWFWHAAPVIRGLVHDAWFPNLILTPYKYLIKAFPNQKVLGKFFGGLRDGEEIST